MFWYIQKVMIKHFESLWEDAEILAAQTEKSDVASKAKLAITEITNLLDSSKDCESTFGKILFQLCGMSQKLNINTYVALMKEIQNRKIDSMPDDED